MRLIIKAKKMPIGTVSHGRKKVAEGKWVPVKRKTRKKKVVASKKKVSVKKKKKPVLQDVSNKPVKSKIFPNVNKADWNINAKMLGHTWTKQAIAEIEFKLGKHWSDPRKKALIQAVLPVESDDWHLTQREGTTKKNIALLAHVLQKLDTETPLEAMGYVERRTGALKTELQRVLEYAAYMENPKEYLMREARGYAFYGMSVKEGTDRAKRIVEKKKKKYGNLYSKIWGKLKKARERPIGSISPSGKTKKTTKGWVPVKKESTGLKSIANEKDVAHSLEAIKSTYAKRPLGKGKELPIASEADLKTILENTTYCFVSAGRNPANKEDMKLTDDQVKERDKKLRDDLKKLGYISTPAIGKYGPLEDSIIVMCHDADKNDMMTLGTKYNQDSVLFCESSNNKLLMTTGDEKGNVSMAGKGYEMVPDANDFYTEVTVGSKKVKFSMALKELTKALGIIWKAVMRRN